MNTALYKSNSMWLASVNVIENVTENIGDVTEIGRLCPAKGGHWEVNK